MCCPGEGDLRASRWHLLQSLILCVVPLTSRHLVRLFSLPGTHFPSFCSDKSYFPFKPHLKYHFLQEAFANPSRLVKALLCFPIYTTLCIKADLLLARAHLYCKLRRPGTISALCSSLSSILNHYSWHSIKAFSVGN